MLVCWLHHPLSLGLSSRAINNVTDLDGKQDAGGVEVGGIARRPVQGFVVCDIRASRARRAGVARGGRVQTTERSGSEEQAARIVVRAVIARVILGETRVGQVVTKRSVYDGRLLLRVGGARDVAIERDRNRYNRRACRAWRRQRRGLRRDGVCFLITPKIC